MVFAGLFPTDSDDYPELRDALERLKLNDAALFYEPETSQALGFGFRCGFLGLLHMEIVRERLEREFDLDLLVTAPNVAYRVVTTVGPGGRGAQPRRDAERDRAGRGAVHPARRSSSRRTTSDAVMELNTRAARSLRPHGVPLRGARSPRLRAAARGDRARLLRPAQVAHARVRELRLRPRPDSARATSTRVDVLIAGEPVDALSLIVHRDGAYARGRALVDRLREEIPRQFFDVPVQAAIGSRVIARETIKAKRKDVLAKCYGGDITRKRKLLERQKAGKKRMKQVGVGRGAAGGLSRRAQPGRRKEVSGGVRHLYVHLPFCASRCGYCDFVTVVGRNGQHRAYVDALLAELSLERDVLAPQLESVFLGGGTPTLTEPRELERLLRALPPAIEVTVEANPETVTPALARSLAESGVTRVSLGAQSFRPQLLGRSRAAGEAGRRPARRLRSP